MNQSVLSNPAIIVNNQAIGFKANSLSIKMGKGEKSVKGVSLGGGLSEIAVSDNIEDRVGMAKFSLYTSKENMDLFNIWKNVLNSSGNTIKITDEQNGFTATLPRAVVTNDPDMNFGVDECFEVEFKGEVFVEFT